MLTSSIETYLNIVMQHLSDLLVETAAWPETAQSDLYSFWTPGQDTNVSTHASSLCLWDTHVFSSTLGQA